MCACAHGDAGAGKIFSHAKCLSVHGVHESSSLAAQMRDFVTEGHTLRGKEPSCVERSITPDRGV